MLRPRRFPLINRPSRLVDPMCRAFRFVIAAALFAPAMFAQMGVPSPKTGSGSIVVRIETDDGRPLDLPARVVLMPWGNASSLQQATADNGTVQFSRLAGGRYSLTVVAAGFKDGNTDVDVLDFGTVEASVTMEVVDDPSTSLGAMGIVLAPKAKKELDDGIAAMHAAKYDEAQKHLEAAFKLAPGNPDVNDTFGEFFLVTKNLPKAQEYLQRAVSLDPANIAALVDTGQLRIQQRDFAGAQTPLEKAVTLAPEDRLAHWLLGVAYLDQHQYEKSRVEAAAAIKISKGVVSEGEYLLGEALAGLGRTPEAITALQTFIHALPKDPYAASAQELLAKLQTEPAEPASQPGLKNSDPAAALPAAN